MQIQGLQKTTLVDFPGKVAATVFVRGCTFHCPFCHNPELVIADQFGKIIDEENIFKFLEKRQGKLKGVCITGGEPTIQHEIESFMYEVGEMGYDVKLDTNGSNPKVLKNIIDAGLADYIAMDVKGPKEKYKKISGSNIEVKTIEKSIELIMSSGVEYEFRTTVFKPWIELSDFDDMGRMIGGAKKYFIQNFQQSKHIDPKNNFEPYGSDELQQVKEIMGKHVDKVGTRD